MDSKNEIAAIALSAAVIILYSLFFAPSPQELKKQDLNKDQVQQTTETDTPSLDKNEDLSKISRKDALLENDRIKFEHKNVNVSITLKSAVIDDLTFTE